MKRVPAWLMLLITILWTAACKTSNTNSNSPTAANTNTPALTNSNSPAPTVANTQPSPTPTMPSLVSPATSPLEALKVWQTAINKGDLEGFKKTLSQKVLKQHEGVDETNTPRINVLFASLTALYENYLPMPFKTRDEDISGDRATYEVRDYGNKWQTVVFVNENGEWKVEEWGVMGAGKN